MSDSCGGRASASSLKTLQFGAAPSASGIKTVTLSHDLDVSLLRLLPHCLCDLALYNANLIDPVQTGLLGL